uniref:Glutathione transferase n=1 Tax=Oncorhynchus tshawytscha TaxID=74940 RepID=A0A8C8FDU6_ONCTS
MAGRKALEVYLDVLSQPCRAIQFRTRLAHRTHYALWQVKCSLVPLPPYLCSLDITHNCNTTFVDNVIADVVSVVAGTQCCFVPTDPLKVERALADLGDTLEKLENMFLKRQPFLCGDDTSLANLLAVCELMQVALDILKDRPKLLSWKSRVQWGKLDEAHTVLYRLWDRSNAKLR